MLSKLFHKFPKLSTHFSHSSPSSSSNSQNSQNSQNFGSNSSNLKDFKLKDVNGHDKHRSFGKIITGNQSAVSVHVQLNNNWINVAAGCCQYIEGYIDEVEKSFSVRERMVGVGVGMGVNYGSSVEKEKEDVKGLFRVNGSETLISDLKVYMSQVKLETRFCKNDNKAYHHIVRFEEGINYEKRDYVNAVSSLLKSVLKNFDCALIPFDYATKFHDDKENVSISRLAKDLMFHLISTLTSKHEMKFHGARNIATKISITLKTDGLYDDSEKFSTLTIHSLELIFLLLKVLSKTCNEKHFKYFQLSAHDLFVLFVPSLCLYRSSSGSSSKESTQKLQNEMKLFVQITSNKSENNLRDFAMKNNLEALIEKGELLAEYFAVRKHNFDNFIQNVLFSDEVSYEELFSTFDRNQTFIKAPNGENLSKGVVFKGNVYQLTKDGSSTIRTTPQNALGENSSRDYVTR